MPIRSDTAVLPGLKPLVLQGRVLGNGVVPAQAAAAQRLLLCRHH